MKPALPVRAGKLAQRLDGLDHTIIEMRERSRLLQEELHLRIEEQGNNSLRVLSVLCDTDASDSGYRRFRNEHQGPAVYRSRYSVLVGIAADGAVFIRCLPHHEALWNHQVVRA